MNNNTNKNTNKNTNTNKNSNKNSNKNKNTDDYFNYHNLNRSCVKCNYRKSPND